MIEKHTYFPCVFNVGSILFALLFVQAKDPHAVQPYLKKCFDAIEELEFGSFSMRAQEGAELEQDRTGGQEEDTPKAAPEIKKARNILTSDITAMISSEGEKVGLGNVSISFVSYFTDYQVCFS